MISQGCEHVKTYFSESAHFHDFHIIREITFPEMMLGIKIRIPKRKPAKWKTLKNVVKRMVFATSPEMKVRKYIYRKSSVLEHSIPRQHILSTSQKRFKFKK